MVYLITVVCIVMFIFFFKQNTAYEMRISDWSSDVCSSDLRAGIGGKRCLSRTRVDQGPRYILLIACRQHLSHFPLPRCGVRDTGVKGKRISDARGAAHP